MNKLKARIYIKQWLELKPYDIQIPTDRFYLKLCNEVKQAIITNKQSFVLQIYLDNDEIDILACFLTSYFEDLISETNIWHSFISIHNRLYAITKRNRPKAVTSVNKESEGLIKV